MRSCLRREGVTFSLHPLRLTSESFKMQSAHAESQGGERPLYVTRKCFNDGANMNVRQVSDILHLQSSAMGVHASFQRH